MELDCNLFNLNDLHTMRCLYIVFKYSVKYAANDEGMFIVEIDFVELQKSPSFIGQLQNDTYTLSRL